MIQKAGSMIQPDIRNFGLPKARYDLSFGTLSHLVRFNVLRCMMVDTVDPTDLNLDDKYRYKLLNAGEIFRLAIDSQSGLPEDFMLQALSKGDECFGIMDGDILASYGWYSNQPTYVSEELRFCFGRQYMYMYGGYTHPGYRGQRLHTIGMAMALSNYLSRGFKGLVSQVEDNDSASLESVHGMGYRDFGKIYILGCFGKYLIHRSPGCKDHEVSVIRSKRRAAY